MALKEKYFYRRDENNRPLITECHLVWDKTGAKISSGYAFCSLRDNPNKMIGKKIARQRAWHAFYSQKDSLPVNTEIYWTDESHHLQWDADSFQFKSQFHGRSGIDYLE